jgi:hypothetical protein
MPTVYRVERRKHIRDGVGEGPYRIYNSMDMEPEDMEFANSASYRCYSPSVHPAPWEEGMPPQLMDKWAYTVFAFRDFESAARWFGPVIEYLFEELDMLPKEYVLSEYEVPENHIIDRGAPSGQLMFRAASAKHIRVMDICSLCN